MNKTQANKPKDIFSWLKEITYIKSPWRTFNEYDKKTFDIYMIHRLISMYEPYLTVANTAQLFPYSDKEKIYNFYCEMLPKKYIFAPYIKGKKEKKYTEEVLKEISQKYQCSIREAKEYIELIK